MRSKYVAIYGTSLQGSTRSAFDYIGAGKSDEKYYDFEKYSTLQGYADDVEEIIAFLNAPRLTFVGHSVSSMIGLLASIKSPGSIGELILIGPSPCYVNDADYFGGFDKQDILNMIDLLEKNFLGWTSSITPVSMKNEDRPELTAELANSFCRMNPDIAKQFARTTFLSDNRADLPKANTPALIIQCAQDAIAPVNVGEYVQKNLGGPAVLALLNAVGHCPHLSAPVETAYAIHNYWAHGNS